MMGTERHAMDGKGESRRWRCGAVGIGGVMLVLFAAAAYHFDLTDQEPYPVLRSELHVEDMQPGFVNPRFRWLDNDRIVALVGERPDPLPRDRKRMIHAMKVWDVRTNDVRTLVPDDVDALCLADGYFRIMVRKSGPDGKETLEFYAGRAGALQRVSPGRFDSMSCRPLGEVPLPEWTNAVRDPAINLRRLRPEHGFLVIDRDSPTDWPRSIRLYRAGEGREQGVDLSRVLGLHRPSPVIMGVDAIWYPHRGAYFVRALTGGEPFWWLSPDGQMAEAGRIPDGGINYRNRRGTGTQMAPTATFPVQGTTDYDHRFIGTGGLYSLADFLNPRRLVRGRIGQELEVSPDGCKVAYANDDRWRIDRDAPRDVFKLQVITLCTEKQP